MRAESKASDNFVDSPPTAESRTDKDAAQLGDAELQERYRKEYLQQLRRLSCPGCGEEPFA